MEMAMRNDMLRYSGVTARQTRIYLADCAVGVHRDWQDESMYQERLSRAEADALRSLLVLEVCFLSNKYYLTSIYRPCDAWENFAVASSPSLVSYDLHRRIGFESPSSLIPVSV
jgi:hypothetical protein